MSPKYPHVCFDRVLPHGLFTPQRTIVTRGGRTRAIAVNGKHWANGSTLHVKFLGGTTAERATAREQANWWTAHANLTFVFDDAIGSNIRIAFDPADGAWSYIGTDASHIPADQPTMNLGFLDGGTAGHEFGHAIGLAHEHQNPAGGIEWNEDVVIQALAGSPNFWDEATTRHNVLDKYSADQIKGTEFDAASIMLYFFPAEWTLNGIGTEENDVLSAMDKAFVASAEMYPKTSPGVSDELPELVVDAAERLRADIGKPGEEDLYKFTATKTGRYVIATGGSTDVVMKLFGPDSHTRVIAEDDDSGYGLNARIRADLTPGEYFVQIRHWNMSGGTGEYTIGVRFAG